MHHRCHGGGAQARKRIKKREGRELSEQLYNKAPFCYQNTHASITHMHTHMTKWPTLLSFSPAKKAHKTEEREREKKSIGGAADPTPSHSAVSAAPCLGTRGRGQQSLSPPQFSQRTPPQRPVRTPTALLLGLRGTMLASPTVLHTGDGVQCLLQ